MKTRVKITLRPEGNLKVEYSKEIDIPEVSSFIVEQWAKKAIAELKTLTEEWFQESEE